MNFKFFLSAIALLVSIHTSAQDFPFNDDNWEIRGRGHVIEAFEGKQSLYLYQGVAEVKELEFLTGEIEFDVYVTDRRGFPGVNFRIQDESNYEEFYIRPHQSGNPDANQYSPVFNGRAAWQLYYGDGYGKAYRYNINAWNHIKLVVAERSAEVYINDMDSPLYFIPELKREPKSGTVGLRNSGPSAFHLANMKVTKIASPELKSRVGVSENIEAGTIQSWQVTKPFKESVLTDVYSLKSKFKSSQVWSTLKSENQGYANLNRVATLERQENTIIARVRVFSEKEQVKKLSYGFSDRVKVFFNDKIISGGNNGYASRDYRFLGTMGYFDDIYLSLKKGENELWFAVSESFGGWGIMAKFDDLTDIELIKD